MKLIELITKNKSPMENPNFKKWFGDSVVVDNNGEPLILFHGTAYDFDVFNNNVIWASENSELASLYATNRIEWDKLEGGSNVVPIYMKIEKPFRANARKMNGAITIKDFIFDMISQAKDNGIKIESIKDDAMHTMEELIRGAKTEESGPYYNIHDFWYKSDWVFGKNATKLIINLFNKLKFDGIIYNEAVLRSNDMTYGAFKSSQIKSAIGNIGTYDTTNPNIIETKN